MDILNFISWVKGGRQVTTVDPSKTLLPVGLKDDRRDDGFLAGAITVQDFLNLAGGGLEGTSYITVLGDKATPAENGLDLQAAYDAAKLATPYGNPLNSANRFTIFVAPGFYFFDTQYNQFVVDAENIDIKSLSGEADVFLSGITVSSPNTYLKGLSTLLAGYIGGIQPGFNIEYSSNMQTFDTCAGSGYSFGYGGQILGTFINCTAGNFSFCSAPSAGSAPTGITVQSGSPILAGVLTNCTAGYGSFAHSDMDSNTEITGTLTNCTAGVASFGTASGVFYGNISGILTNCTAENTSFTSWGAISGTLTNCKVNGPNSFGGFIATTGVFYNCIGVDNCFGGSFMQYFSGKAYNCIGGQNTFGNMDTGPGSPANFIDTFSGGRVSYCTKTTGVFSGASPSGPNSVIACQDSAGLKTF